MALGRDAVLLVLSAADGKLAEHSVAGTRLCAQVALGGSTVADVVGLATQNTG